MNNYLLDEIMEAAEASNDIPMWFNNSKYSLGIVYNSNGKRITLSKSLCLELGVKDNVYVLAVPSKNTLLISSSQFSEKSSPLSCRGDGRKTCYNAEAVQKISESFELDFAKITSMTFTDISIEKLSDIPVAMVNMISKANNHFGDNN